MTRRSSQSSDCTRDKSRIVLERASASSGHAQVTPGRAGDELAAAGAVAAGGAGGGGDALGAEVAGEAGAVDRRGRARRAPRVGGARDLRGEHAHHDALAHAAGGCYIRIGGVCLCALALLSCVFIHVCTESPLSAHARPWCDLCICRACVKTTHRAGDLSRTVAVCRTQNAGPARNRLVVACQCETPLAALVPHSHEIAPLSHHIDTRAYRGHSNANANSR